MIVQMTKYLSVPADPHCQDFIAFDWIFLEPGDVGVGKIDMSGCSSDHFGNYQWVGLMIKHPGARTIRQGDEVETKVVDLATLAEYTDDNPDKNDEQRPTVPVTGPASYEGYITNNTHKRIKVRCTWEKGNY